MRRQPRTWAAVTVAATCVAFAGVAATPATATTGTDADAIRAWNAITMTTITTAAKPTAEQPLYLAYVHRAVYFAVRSATTSEHVSVPAAVATAAHDVLVADFPTQQATLDDDYSAAMADIPAGAERRTGIRVGAHAARRLVTSRVDDGRDGAVLPLPTPGPGVWIPTPPNTAGASSWLGAVTPFGLRSASQFRPGPPPALSSNTWAQDYNEVRLYGSSTSTLRTPEQTEAARFWSDPPYVQNQAGLRDFTERHGLDAMATARLFAMADTAAADALIGCWDAKYHYYFWRPFSAIPAGDTDGNNATPADSAWQPLLATPNHPEYPSAHGCATSALALVVAALTSPDGQTLDLDLHSVVTGTTHHFSSVGQLLDEVANARVWGGLHWRLSTDAGVRLGTSVARFELRHPLA